MKRTACSLKNLVYGGITQAVSSLLSFVSRFALIHIMGLEAVSLNGLFTEVIAMLSLAELGVSTAITYHLYKPLREHDEEKLAQLMNFFKTAYRLIALTIFIIGLLLLPYIHLLVTRMEVELWYLRLIYFLFLVQTALSYLFSYKGSLISADQKSYVVSQCTLAVRVLSTTLSIVFLVLTKNYIIYLLFQISAVLGSNIAVSIRVNRRYPLLKRKDRLPAEERRQAFTDIRYLFIGVLSGKITNSTDNILISTLVGTLYVGAYGGYTAIINAMKSLLMQIHLATSGSMGDLVAEGNLEKMDHVLRRLTFITFCPTVFAAVAIYTISTPFIRLVYGEMYLMPMEVVFLCVLNFFIYLIKNPLWSLMAVSGLFAENKNISLAGDGLNLLVSILLGRKLGIVGILLGTSCTLLLQCILKTRLLFRKFLNLSGGPYILLVIKEAVVCVVCILTAQALCIRLPISNLYLQILGYGICSTAITAAVFFLAFSSAPEFAFVMETVKHFSREQTLNKKI